MRNCCVGGRTGLSYEHVMVISFKSNHCRLVYTLNLGEYYRMMTDFYLNYAVLVINSFGLQDALERKGMNIPYFFSRVYMAAHRCAILVRDRLGPSGHLKYSPDSHFVQTSYAVLSLLKVGIPKAVIDYAPSLFLLAYPPRVSGLPS
jgi:hypothetical protein